MLTHSTVEHTARLTSQTSQCARQAFTPDPFHILLREREQGGSGWKKYSSIKRVEKKNKDCSFIFMCHYFSDWKSDNVQLKLLLWQTPITSAFGRMGQMDQKFKTNLRSTTRSCFTRENYGQLFYDCLLIWMH